MGTRQDHGRFQRIGSRFEIRDLERDLLGRGGMGEVYRGRDIQTGQTVAIKALRREVVAGDPDVVARFVREGEALRHLNHPNIAKAGGCCQRRWVALPGHGVRRGWFTARPA